MSPDARRARYSWYIVLALAVPFAIGLMANGAIASVSATPPDQTKAGDSSQPSDGHVNPALTPTATFCAPTTPLNEGFESGTLGTFASSVATCVPGGCGWASVTTAAHTGTHSAFAPDVSNIADQRLTSLTPIAIPAGTTGASLRFWQSYTFETTGSTYYDGGVLEVSTNGGTTWVDAGANIVQGGYGGAISNDFGNPLAGRQAWVATTGTTFTETVANLLPYAGTSVLFRFREGSDSSIGRMGWWIDDVTVVIGGACATPTSTSIPGGCPIQITGSITAGDATQTNRLFRGGVAGTCGPPGTCSTSPGTFHYDAYTFTNSTGGPACVTVDLNTTCTGTNFIFSAAYLGTF